MLKRPSDYRQKVLLLPSKIFNHHSLSSSFFDNTLYAFYINNVVCHWDMFYKILSIGLYKVYTL